ncbi:MAG: LD-carboxypeptidase, partial [Polyangiaceae bacterium]|nr:LD-carboxypeptidase [Polyangiaceae bacterium]
MIIPAPLSPGDLIDVIEPSSPCDKTLAFRGLGWLREHFRVRFDNSIFSSTGYLAGDDNRRTTELDLALRAPDSKAIVAVRGGYGLHRIAHRIDWTALRTNPKWLVGFSDATVLHVEAAKVGVASLHATMVAGLGRGNDLARTQWIASITHPLHARRWSGLEVLRSGCAEGTSFGGNITVLHACAASGRLRIPPNSILFIEDVGEKPYRIDRMLTTLRVGGTSKTLLGSLLENLSTAIK